MPNDLEKIVQRMIDSGEPEENIATVIREYHGVAQPPQPKPPPTTFRDEPTTFASGVMNSLNPFGTGSEGSNALRASGEGARGFWKGAIADLPSSVGGALTSIGDAIMDPRQAMSDAWEGAKALPGRIADTTMHAGSDPNAFGEMVGQYTGQPLATEGLIKGARVAGPPAIRAAGTPVEFAGKVGKGPGLLSGMLPPGIARWMEPSYVRMADRALAGGVEKIGKSMKNFGLDSGELSMPEITDMGNAPTITDMGNVPPNTPAQGQLMEPGARFSSDVMGDTVDYQNPPQRPSTAMVKRGPTDLAGREVAPPQAEYPQRPAGPWDNNANVNEEPPLYNSPDDWPPMTPAEKAEMGHKSRVNKMPGLAREERMRAADAKPITAESFGKDFFKTQGNNITAKLRTQFATPQIVESLKSQGFRFSGLDKQGKMIFTKPQ